MSGLFLRSLMLIAAAAMSGVTAFNVAPGAGPMAPLHVASPELLTGRSLTLDPAPFAPTRAYVADAGIAERVAILEAAEIETRPRESVTIAFGGDILIHGNVRSRASLGGGAYDFSPMFESVRPAISGADLAICHLEVPLTSTNSDLSTYPRFNAPHEVADAIAYAGFDGCSTASNHSIDKGVDGLLDTIDILEKAGVAHTGTARSEEESLHATIHEIEDGPVVAHIAATYWLNGLRTPEGQDWLAQRIDVGQIEQMAEEARRSGADLVVVSIHCCTEYVAEPTAEQVAIFDGLIRSGWIDLVVGHHSHVVGPVARIGQEFVVYGLGNLLSGQLHRTDTSEGALAFATAEWTGRRWRFAAVDALPVRVEGGSFALVAAPPESASFARTMAALSTRNYQVGYYSP